MADTTLSGLPAASTPLAGTELVYVVQSAASAKATAANIAALAQAQLQIQDEGTNLGAAGTVDTIDFVGSGVSAARVGDVVTVTIAAGGGGDHAVTLQAASADQDAAIDPQVLAAVVQSPFSGTISRWRMTADRPCTAAVDIWKRANATPDSDAYSIVASAPPTLTADDAATSATLTGWTTSISAGDVFRMEITANDAAAAITVTLEFS